MDLTHVIAERENKKIFRDGDKAIKVFAEGYSKADILNEALNTARVEETGLPIPKLLAVDTVNGQWAITTEFVEGDTLAALMAAHPEKEDEYLNLFVDIQMKVHAPKRHLFVDGAGVEGLDDVLDVQHGQRPPFARTLFFQ